MSVSNDRTDQRRAPKPRRSFLAEMVAGMLALPLLVRTRSAAAQAVYYDQYGQPVTIAPGSVVTPAPTGAPPAPGYGYYGPSGVVGQSRRVARRTSRRTGRREDVREDVRDEIYD